MGHLQLFGHEGEDHSKAVAAVSPWWTNELTLDIVLILGFVSMLLLTKYAFKMQLGTRLILVMIYLLVTGLLVYQISPAMSVVSLALGMGLALATTFFQVGHKK